MVAVRSAAGRPLGGASLTCLRLRRRGHRRLFIALPDSPAAGTYEIEARPAATALVRRRLRAERGGTVRIASVRAGCVAGEVDFGAAGRGSLAVAPC